MGRRSEQDLPSLTLIIRPENLELWGVKGQSKKDPAGQRAADLIERAVSVAERYGIHPPALRLALEDVLFRGA